MIHIKNSDTLIDIIEKIESSGDPDIILDFPLGHPVLHNYISLKLLKSKTKTKNLFIVTNDHVGKKIGKELGIKYSTIKHQKFIKKKAQSSLMRYNFGFWEFFTFQIQSYYHEIKSSIHSNQKLYALKKYSHKYQKTYSLRVFSIALIACLGLFMFIYYFAVSKSYVDITPETIIRKEASNFLFKEKINNDILGNNKNIKIEKIKIKTFTSETYTSTEISENSTNNATGKVLIYNKQLEEQELIKNTRLQDKNGKVFLLNESVNIPAGIKDNFGKVSAGILEVNVTARVKDAFGSYIGIKGNIKAGTRFLIPGLDEESQKLIYAESIEDFTGGTNDFTKVLSQEDVDTGKALFTEKLKSEALNSLRKQIQEKNKQSDGKLNILTGWEKSIKYSEININIGNDIRIGEEIENFDISGSIIIEGYIYNEKSIIQRLRTLINEKQLEGIEKISFIDTNSLRMSQLIYAREGEEGESNFELKATYEIEALLLHDFLHIKNNYINYLKSQIQGKNKDDAEKILLNDPRISNAKISIRPFFSKKVSRIPANIIFEVK